MTPQRGLVCAAASLAAAGGVLGGTAEAQPAPPATERREVVFPLSGAERVRIENPLGRVQVRAWDHPGEIHIVVEKRGPTTEALDRLRVHYTAWKNGEIEIEAYVMLGGRERSVPLSGSQVDLLVELPPELEVSAKTFGGDLSVSGLDAGAHLETTGGRIGVSNVRGAVVTRQLRGGQTVFGVEGDVDLDGVEGDLDLKQLGGGRVDAKVMDGNIRAEGVRSRWVRLRSTTGQVIFVGLVQPGGRYEVHSYAGDIRVTPADGSVPFELRARSPHPVDVALGLRGLVRPGDLVRAAYRDDGGRPERAERALVELRSTLGRIAIQPR